VRDVDIPCIIADSCHIRSERSTTPSKTSGNTSSKTSTSSKDNALHMGKSKSPGLQDFRKHSANGSISQISGYATSPRRQDPYLPGQHFGERVQGLFNDMIDFDDKMRDPDPSADTSAPSKSKSKSKSKSGSKKSD
jgi:hypothetical protein